MNMERVAYPNLAIAYAKNIYSSNRPLVDFKCRINK